MAYPRNLGDKQIFREDFTSVQSVADNGGVLTNATVSNGVMTCTAGGTAYQQNIDSIFTMGGTLRIRYSTTDTVGNAKRIFAYAKDSNWGLVLARINSTGRIIAQAHWGAGNTYRVADATVGASTDIEELVVVWDVANLTVTTYLNGVFLASDSTAGGPVLSGLEDADPSTIKLGDNTVIPWTGTIEEGTQIMLGTIWTAEEVLDAYENDTYQEIDAAKMDVSTPLRSWYNDGSNNVTKNLGTAGNFLWGDGAGNNEPTQLQPKGALIDTTQYIITETDIAITSTKDWSLSYGANIKDTGTVLTHFHAQLGSYLTDGFVINQLGPRLYFYWNSASPSWSALSTFFRDGIHFICLISDGGVVTAYMDGEAMGSIDLSAKPAFSGNYPLKFGNITASAESDLLSLNFEAGKVCTPRQVRNMHQTFLRDLNN